MPSFRSFAIALCLLILHRQSENHVSSSVLSRRHLSDGVSPSSSGSGLDERHGSDSHHTAGSSGSPSLLHSRDGQSRSSTGAGHHATVSKRYDLGHGHASQGDAGKSSQYKSTPYEAYGPQGGKYAANSASGYAQTKSTPYSASRDNPYAARRSDYQYGKDYPGTGGTPGYGQYPGGGGGPYRPPYNAHPPWVTPRYQYVRFKTLYDTTKDRRKSSSCYEMTPYRAWFLQLVSGTGCDSDREYYTHQGGWCFFRNDQFSCGVTGNIFQTREQCFDACMPRCEVFEQDEEDCKYRGYQRKIGYTVDESRFECVQIHYYHGCPGKGNLFQNYFDCKRECQEEYEI